MELSWEPLGREIKLDPSYPRIEGYSLKYDFIASALFCKV